MFRYLMDNAIASKDALSLSLGVSLTSEQVVALTHDIVWMEEREVRGETVLVPVLYMAQAQGRLAPSGALIQGHDVALISGAALNNQGTLRTSHNLDAHADNITNSGLMQANARLQLLASDSIRNTQGGIISGGEVSLVAGQDIINERSVTTHESSIGDRYQYRRDFISSAARIEAEDGLNIMAGRDVLNVGSTLQSGGDMLLEAGRDLVITSAETVDQQNYRDRKGYAQRSDITQHASQAQAGGHLQASAGRDLGLIASHIKADASVSLEAGGDVTIASAANESHYDAYRKSSGKTVRAQGSRVAQQSSQIEAGTILGVLAGGDLALTSSQLKAGDEAYLVAGGKVQLLAEQDYDYSFSEKKKKGSFGRKSFKSDERTQVTHVGSSITSGGDLAIISGDEQRYQAAQLSSGGDLTLDSGAGIVFEGVKDLEQQSRIRSKNSWVWQSAKGKGHTDETLIQSQLQAQGEVAIRAAERIQIDIKEVNQQSVSQTIDAMVQADPQLAWLKDMEQRGDVDWRQVKELHDSFKYSSSGLSGPAAMVIAIVVAYFTAGAASGLIGAAANATAGSAMAAGTAATAATATTVGTAATAAGWGNVALSAVAASAASNTAISAINNKGNLGVVLKDVTSSDSLKGYAVTGITAGLTAGVYDKWTSTQTGASNTAAVSNNTGVLANSGNVALEGAQGLSSWGGVGQFAANQALQNTTSAALNKVLGQEGSFGDALTSTLANTFAAAGFNWVGDISLEHGFKEGGLSKIGLHAIMGGLAAEAAGGDFKSGALVAGANEALIDTLANQYDNMSYEQRSGLLTMNSQVLGVLVASAAGGDEKDMQIGASVAGNATQYNRQLHLTERELAQRLAEESDGRYTIEQIEEQMRLSNITGTGINPSTDMLVDGPEAIYDTGGHWVELSDGRYMQVFNTTDMNPEIMGYINEKTGIYDWEMPKPLGSITDGLPDRQRDKLTGYSLDSEGGYRIPIIIDGKRYSPRFHPCGTAECLAVGANIDFADPDTLKWIRAADINTLDNAGTALSLGAVFTPAGPAAVLSTSSSVLTVVSGYLAEDSGKRLSEVALSEGFQKYAIKRGVNKSVAARITNALSATGFWGGVVDEHADFNYEK